MKATNVGELHDVIVLGTGAAGLIAALSAHAAGLKPLVLEKADVWGGTTAMSGGVLWMPGNELMREDGEPDSPEEACRYLKEITAQDGPAASLERRATFIRQAPVVTRFLADIGIPWKRIPNYPDYESEREGARLGRPVQASFCDGRILGSWLGTMRRAAVQLPVFSTSIASRLPHARRRLGPMMLGLRVLAEDRVRRALGQVPLARGEALVARLMRLLLDRQVPVRLGVSVERLVQNARGEIVGVVADGEQITSRNGVILCTGGFAQNAEIRRKHQAVSTEWSNASPDDAGDAIVLGSEVGGSVSLMDSAWWMPTVMLDEKIRAITLPERGLPGSIIVDSSGRRYMNEAASYMIAGRAMMERDKTVAAVPSWLIAEADFFKRYITGIYPADLAVRAQMQANGFLVEALTIVDLAERCRLPAEALAATIDRFNGFARAGVDQDFQRGASRYDRYWGDPYHRPNPSLGTIGSSPFVAIQIWPGDLGTNGGLLTDEHARVLDSQGNPISGLWAAGNACASVMGRAYAGAGATLGAAAVFGFVAGQDAAAGHSGSHAGSRRPG